MLIMHRTLLYLAFGWLTAGGTLHFIIDVLSQYMRGKRVRSAETTLYYGLNSAYALGQMLFGLIGLWLAWRAFEVLDERPVVVLCLLGAIGWLAIDFLFIEYREPKSLPRYSACSF
jgi:MFS family permease